ncbi:MAG: hypothetical protein ACI902_002844 [Psychroserpens sp.]|jgi:hypothetical protein
MVDGSISDRWFTIPKVKAQKNRFISEPVFISELLLLIRQTPYFTLFTIASKATGLFIAKSARTLRFNWILLVLSFPINLE